MRILSQVEADELLRPLQLKIGEWNRLNDLASDDVPYKVYHPSRDTRELYVLAGYLLDWFAPEGWVLLQVDNSTWPSDDETGVFERLAFAAKQRWDIDTQRSFLFGDSSEDEFDIDRHQLILLIFFSLMFEWHVYLTCEKATPGQRLGLQDGVVYFIGEAKLIDAADATLQQIAENPLRFSRPA
ncbi:hypothetical protein HBA54_02190 [Pelagibius litoralis]|uniref:Uncharacterized protein n=1 Tax=Pelagibius litoralis TaxID=374515 RepID=A0A967CAG8_9PROT|nr:hypothetical protein [Pelagibius litoralis]NIA67394.1 hypothetical protein [Pelagibius litoralis]